eukprot:TRINITY_DN1701_c0_g1_i1.p3 TRINITY_DN1701_c0_g1~~TRINITY_DN1701_c0_g1_i1.p3  ORF type:complete len:227 (+),score=60.95 TRINITY_DN1701_c0_g1_i1:28-681(+)
MAAWVVLVSLVVLSLGGTSVAEESTGEVEMLSVVLERPREDVQGEEVVVEREEEDRGLTPLHLPSVARCKALDTPDERFDCLADVVGRLASIVAAQANAGWHATIPEEYVVDETDGEHEFTLLSLLEKSIFFLVFLVLALVWTIHSIQKARRCERRAARRPVDVPTALDSDSVVDHGIVPSAPPAPLYLHAPRLPPGWTAVPPVPHAPAVVYPSTTE